MVDGCFVAFERCVVKAPQYGRTCVCFHGAFGCRQSQCQVARPSPSYANDSPRSRVVSISREMQF